MPHQRITVHFSGHVQGVGFRYVTREIAMNHPVVGYVRNLSDGRVRLIAEGPPEALEAFVNAVVERMREHISNHGVESGPATGEFGTPGVDAFLIRG